MIALDELEGSVIDRIHRLVRVEEEISETISELSRPEEREVLQRRYLSGQKWEQICVDMRCSWRQVHRFHSTALREIDRILKDGTQ